MVEDASHSSGSRVAPPPSYGVTTVVVTERMA